MSGQAPTPISNILSHSPCGTSHEWGKPLLRALAAHQHKAVVKMNVAHIEPHQLAHAQATSIEHFQNGMVPQTHLPFREILVEERRDIPYRETLRKALRLFGQAQCSRRVLGDDSIANQKGMQTFHGRNCTLHRGIGVAPVAPITDKTLYYLTVHAFKGINTGPLQVGTVSRQVTTICRDRIARQASLDRKVIKILPRHRIEQRGSIFGMSFVRWHP